MKRLYALYNDIFLYIYQKYHYYSVARAPL